MGPAQKLAWCGGKGKRGGGVGGVEGLKGERPSTKNKGGLGMGTAKKKTKRGGEEGGAEGTRTKEGLGG